MNDLHLFDYWKFIAGLGFFLFGMKKIEEAMKALTGKRFKLFIRKYTTNKVIAILNGLLATAILQSSSVVLLMVIAFSGAGILSLSHSLGIILGANLGTTITGWIISTLGFKANFSTVIYPLIGIGSIGIIFFTPRFRFYHFFSFFIAFGLLLMGLSYMKDSLKELSQIIRIEDFDHLGFTSFFLFGLLMTALIQSSSAMMTITLSALFSGIINLESAAAITIGADLGTTFTALIGSIGGPPLKKRVGLAHFFFNLGTVSIAAIFLHPLLFIIKNVLSISSPLTSLVAFHSLFNLIGILVYFPFLNMFESFLNKFFTKENTSACEFLPRITAEVPEASLEALKLELKLFSRRVYYFNTTVIGFPLNLRPNEKSKNIFEYFINNEFDITNEYEKIKKIENEILDFITLLQHENLDPKESQALQHYILALRNGVQSSKSLKDINHNLNELKNTLIDSQEQFYKISHELFNPINEHFSQLWKIENKNHLQEEIYTIFELNEEAYKKVNAWIYQNDFNKNRKEIDFATMLNVSLEIYRSYNLLGKAILEIDQDQERPAAST